MFDRIDTFRMARALTDHATRRQTEGARNVANADTPGYLARDLEDFTDSYRRPLSGDLSATRARHMPSPFWSGANPREIVERDGGSPNGNTVSLEDEMARSADINREHEVALAVYRSGLDILRTSLGRRS